MSVRIHTTSVIVVGAIAYWWAVFLAMHVLQPEFNPIEAPGSAYVLGAYGPWMTTTYFALTAALLSARLGLTAHLAATTSTRLAGAAFLIAAVCAALAGMFPMDFPPPPRTVSGRLHAVAGMLTFLPWVIGTSLFTLGIRRDRRWVQHSGTVLALAVVSLGMVAMLLLAIRLNFAGAAQRLLLATLFAWLLVVASHLRCGDNQTRSVAA